MSQGRLNGNKRKMYRKALIRRDGNRCHWCKAEFTDELPPTFEHVVPVSQGGSSALKNLRLACEPCNNERGDNVEWTPPVYGALARAEALAAGVPHWFAVTRWPPERNGQGR